MKYDVFISYASADRPWADRLHAELNAVTIDAFQDNEDLHVGDGWEKQIDQALDESRHLVCLWSAHSARSQWVQREIARLLAMRDLTGRTDRKLLIVQLDDTPNAYGSLQQVIVPALKQAYRDSKLPLEPAAWKQVIERIGEVVKLDPNAITIPVALFTLTAQELGALGSQERADAAKAVGLSEADLSQRYQARRIDWKPFGGDKTFADLLDEVKGQLDKALKPRWVRWRPPDDKFLQADGNALAKEFAAAMCAEDIGAIVIDPVALSSGLVLGRLGSFLDCLKHEGIAVIALPPRPASEETRRFRDWLADRASALLQQHFEPPVQPSALRAHIGVGLDDTTEILRLLRASVGVSLALHRSPAPAAEALDNRVRS